MLFLYAESNHREMIEVCESGLRFRTGEREGERIGEMGLFTRVGLEAGALLGFYTGRATQEPDKWSVHLMEDCMAMTPVVEGMERPDFRATRRPEAYSIEGLGMRDDQIYPAAHFLIDKVEHY